MRSKGVERSLRRVARVCVRGWAVSAAALLLFGASPVRAQLPLHRSPSHGVHRSGERTEAAAPVTTQGRYLVVSLAEHRVFIMEDDRVLWSTAAGTGTGTRLAGAGQKWNFSTPRGMFRVQLKQKDPVWILPDWYFVERGEPVPHPDSPTRRRPGELGTSALFLGEEIAIHGTDRPDRLGDDVSHGCIRVSNEAARQLYHEVEVGTPVLIY